MTLRLGINIDHVATLRNARGGIHPEPVRAARLVQKAGADGLTIHLREDRRHIRDADVFAIKEACSLPMNLEMAATDEMLAIALKTKPNACCIVPEKREELTTEGGLDVIGQQSRLQEYSAALREAGIRVSLFIDPTHKQLEAVKACQADIVELHTGAYCEAAGQEQKQLLRDIEGAAKYAHSLGIECHAGHGLDYDNVSAIAKIPQIVELNIGHFLMGEALFVGLEESIRKMRQLMNEARA